MKLNHSTDFYTLFQIWKDGELHPQPYCGGYSSAEAGEYILFCFPESRYLFGGMMEVIILLPEGTPAREGKCWSWDEDLEGFTTETEFHVMEPIKLERCSIFVSGVIPTPDEFLWNDDRDSTVVYADGNVNLVKQYIEFLKEMEVNHGKEMLEL